MLVFDWGATVFGMGRGYVIGRGARTRQSNL